MVKDKKNTVTNHSETKEDIDLKDTLSKIKSIILVLSGKGGVGKSTVAVNLAISLAEMGKKVGLLDIDIHGPSVPILLGMQNKSPQVTEDDKIHPLNYKDMLKVMSIGFLLPEDKDAVIWRGPLKHNLIRQFLSIVLWGNLDFLIVDSPPGTGDEPLSIAQMMKGSASAVLVTTPQRISISDVKKSVTFCRQLNLPVLGIIENMSGFICEHCGKETKIFKTGGGRALAEEMKAPFLGSIPLDPEIVNSTDDGNPYILANRDSKAAQAYSEIVKSLIGKLR